MPGNIINLNAEDMAAWPQPNYIDPDRRAWMPEYAGVLYGMATIMVATRMWLRVIKRSGGLGIDDAFLLCSWIALTWFTALAILGSEEYMTSRHLWDVPVDVFANMARIVWIAELAFLVTGCLVKISVLLFYRRLVRDTFSPAWRWAVISAISFTVAYTLAFILALVFNCSPTEAYWQGFNPNYDKQYSCADTTIINSLSGVMGILGDLYSVALPCIMTRNLMLPFAQKVGLCLIFSLGLLVTGASCMRTYYLHALGTTSDVSWTIYTTFVWAQLELTLSLMCASAPALRVIFREYCSEPIIRAKRSVMSSKSRKCSNAEFSLAKQAAGSRETLRCDPDDTLVVAGSTIEEEDTGDTVLTKKRSLEVAYGHSAEYATFSLENRNTPAV